MNLHFCINAYIHISVFTHCQMNQNPCSNQEIQVLFEHGLKLENTVKRVKLSLKNRQSKYLNDKW